MSSIRVRPRKDGTSNTSVLFRLSDGTQSSRSFDDHQAALNWGALVDRVGPEKAIEILETAPDPRSLMTVSELCNLHIEQLSLVEEGTIKRYKSYVDYDIDPAIGSLPLHAFDEVEDAKWVKWLIQEGNAPKTVANKHGFLSAAMNTGVRLKSVPLQSNPCEGCKLPEIVTDEMVFFTPAQFCLFLRFVPKFWSRFVEFSARTGLRFGEVTALMPEDFRESDRSFMVSRAWKYTAGDGHRLGAPKTRRSRRRVYLDEETWELAAPGLCDPADGQFVFTNKWGGPVRSATFYTNVWATALWYANGAVKPYPEFKEPHKQPTGGLWTGIEPAPEGHRLGIWPGFHALRHSCASWMIADGQDLLAVSRHLGHESIQTTCDMYGHLDPSRMVASISGVSKTLLEARHHSSEIWRTDTAA